MRDVKPRASGRKLTWRGFCAPFAGAPELNDDKQAGIRYDVRATAVKLANAAYMLKTCPADALAHLLPHLLRLLGDDAASELRRLLLDGLVALAPAGMLSGEWGHVKTAIEMAAFLKPDDTGIACAAVLDRLVSEPVTIARLRPSLAALEGASRAAITTYLKGWAGGMLALRDAHVPVASPPLASPPLASPPLASPPLASPPSGAPPPVAQSTTDSPPTAAKRQKVAMEPNPLPRSMFQPVHRRPARFQIWQPSLPKYGNPPKHGNPPKYGR